MKKFKIEVKPWMMQKSSEGFDFMLKFNNDIPMPLKIMYGYKIDETKGMVKLVLNGDLREKITQRCMMCGKVINNPISQFFGLGPICGGHNYTNPFDNEEDLKAAVDAFRTKLVNTKWTGWVAKSAILSVYDEVTDEFIRPEDMPMEVDPSKVEEPKMSDEAAKVNAEFARMQKLITARVDKPTRGTEEYSVYLSFQYNSAWVAAVKNLPIRFWNNDTKEWEILYSELADLQDTLSDATFEVIGADQVKTSETKIPSSFTYKTKPFSHQVAGIQYGMEHDRWLLCDQQGCISGDAEVWINEAGKPATRSTKLSNLYKLIQKDPSIKIKCMVNGRFGYMPIKGVYDTGIKPVIKLHLEDTYLVCTPDHRIYTPNGWVEATNLKIGDKVFTNGKQVCPICGTDTNLITYPNSKFLGYCRKCMYANRNGRIYKDAKIIRTVDEDGYVRLKGIDTRTMPNYNTTGVIAGGIYEHHQVWYENTGHIVDTNTEVVHHKNHIRTDNRFENLQLMTIHEHAKLHSAVGVNHLPQYNTSLDKITKGKSTIYLAPREQTITNIEVLGTDHVYDVEIDHPEIHNFIANNVVVHNCGKTLQIIDLAAIRKITDGFKHCLIICGVNGLKWNWEEEIATHSNEKSYILGQKFFTRGRNRGKKYVGTIQDRLNDALNLDKIEEYFIITNVETLRNTKIAEALGKACEAGIIGLVAIDEFHMCRNAFTKQSEGIMKLQPKYRIGMTGTPLMNTPLDFYSIFNWLGYEPYGYRAFRNHFCIFDEWNAVVGYKNTEDLTKVLDKIMLRRTKEEVLDLPEKTYINEYIELNEDQMRQYNQAFALACQQLEKDDAEYNPLAEIIRLRQATGCFGPFESITANPKLDRVEQLVQEAINQNDKVVIFSQWTEMTDLIVKRLEKYGVVSITGDTKDSDRQAIVNRFQTDSNVKVFVGSMKAVGVGITLTAASTVIFTDEPWTHGAFEQCVDRCHRIGTSKNVTVHTILAHNTIDEKVHDIMMMKANLSAKLVDGQMTYTRNDVIKYLFAA